MEHKTKNKVLTWLVVVLLTANATSIAMFWLGKGKPSPATTATPPQQPPRQQGGTPAEFLIRELQLDSGQQVQLEILRAAHKDAAVALRNQMKDAKQLFFALIKQPGATDSEKQAAAKAVSNVYEKIDLLTLNHFTKIRALCNARQQIRFDAIIEQLTDMISKAGEPPPQDGNRLPRDDRGKRPPPPRDGEDNPPPPRDDDGSNPPPPKN
jgi:flagellar basal body-associated protein FliL